MKLSFFLAAVVSILLYGCTTWTPTKRMEKKLDGNYSRMLRASPDGNIPQGINYTATCLPSRKLSMLDEPEMQDTAGEELIRDVLLWTPSYGQAKAGRPARTYIQQLCEDTGCSLEDLPETMNDREKCRERVRDIRASGTTWWWLYIYIYIYIYIYFEREREMDTFSENTVTKTRW